MKIAVISGSPKGRDSATLRYVRFLQLNYPQADFRIEHVGQQIGKLEKNNAFFDSLIDRIKEADAVLWATPVYYFVVPSQLKRFIELVFERDRREAFSGKTAASLITSIHFFDHTAVYYLHAVSEDLGMHYGGSYTAEMNDLRRRREKRRLLSFGKIMLAFFETDPAVPYCRTYPVSPAGNFVYQPGKPEEKIDPAGKRIVIVADLENTSTSLAGMVKYLMALFIEQPELINLADKDISLGCRGCLACGAENRCFYEKRDSFRDFFEDKVKKADILIIAGEIRDRFLSARIKRFMDRSFYMNHVPYFGNKQVGLLIAGPLGHNANIRDILESYIRMHDGNPAGIVTDEPASSKEIDALLEKLAADTVFLAGEGYLAPPSFPLVGGRKIFRDFIAGPAQLVFPADYRYYRENRFFDYPHRKRGLQAATVILRNLLKIPRFRREFSKRIVKGLVQPLDRSLSS
ncbi:MAG TPA: hypothetical protein ENN91_00990 [Firmicutes bacterium]|nr:hypothetical protein [Bacillota bacterium]